MRRGIVTLTTLTLAVGCTAGPAAPDRADPTGVGMRLVAFDTCAEALADLRAAAKASVGPWGLYHPLRDVVSDSVGAGPVRRTRDQAGTEKAATGQQHSTTNNHDAAADEPDRVKTDGVRIVTLTDGTLRVVDPARRTVTGTLALDGEGDWTTAELLLHGDRALVLLRRHGMLPAVPQATGTRPAFPPSGGTSVQLVDLTGAPRVVGSYRIDGELVDARKIGGTARVVVRSHPAIALPAFHRNATDEERTAANQAAIDRTPLADWLPRYEWTDGGTRRGGRLPCDRLSRPDGHTGSTLLNLLSFDLGTGRLGDGDPLGVVAEGDTVYGTAGSLYVADRLGRWGIGVRRPSSLVGPPPGTEIHRFDLTAPGRPRYVASGTVPGYLINQYALSEWGGHLRVATTTGTDGPPDESSSGVYVLRTDGPQLRRVGEVTGLGRTEQIHSVRYLGDRAYLVTFRRTDPLYALDLSDPTAPRTTGELKITGYSGHLQPLSDGRLLGVGREADRRGRLQGLLVSLFDVTDPAKPTRLARYHRPEYWSTADHEPKALLHWPATGLLVLPVATHAWTSRGAVVLRVDGSTLHEVGRITHRGRPERTAIQRSMVVGDTLWTYSEAGLQANDPVTLATRGWLPTT